MTDMTTYILELTNGNLRKVTVPSKWTVTFGPAVPYMPGKHNGFGGSSGERGYAIRFYEKKNNQRAIFTDVRSFRDVSIEIEDRITNTKRQTMRKNTPQGARDVEVEARMTEWVNPDAPAGETPTEFLAIGNAPTDPDVEF